MKSKFFATASLAAIVLGFTASSALAAPAVTLTPTWDHPSAKVGVSGTGFSPSETIDIYFDTTDELLVVADSGGKFAKHTFKSPGDALPGQHWVTAIGRKIGDAAQKPFTVSTAWAELGFKPAGQRNNPWENVISTANVKKLDTAWVVNGIWGYSSPAVVNGIVYSASDDGKLYAFDASSGAQLWVSMTVGEITSSPAVGNGNVFLTSYDNNLYAFNSATGALSWSAVIGPSGVSPAVANGVVYVTGNAGNGTLYAFDAATGGLHWSTTLNANSGGSPAVSNGMVYIGTSQSQSTGLYAFDAQTGALRWSTPLAGTYAVGTPAVANGVVYAGSSGGSNGLLAFNAQTGALLWAVVTGQIESFFRSAPAIADGVVYYGSGGPNLFAFDAKTGEQLWSTGVSASYFSWSSPAVANGLVYVTTPEGNIDALDAASGTILWRGTTDYEMLSSPAIADGILFAHSFTFPNNPDSGLYAYALNGGNNAIYKNRHTQPPSFASLHPDYRLKP